MPKDNSLSRFMQIEREIRHFYSAQRSDDIHRCLADLLLKKDAQMGGLRNATFVGDRIKLRLPVTAVPP
jgi:hypothetical protein